MRSAVVLLSGGLDSATCLAWARREGFTAHALTLDYGQRHRVEVERAAFVATSLGAASHRTLAFDLSFLAGSALTDSAIDVPEGRAMPEAGSEVPITYVPARNTILLALALGLAESMGSRDLVIGANAIDYSGYPDCRPAFLQAFQSLASLGTKAGVEGAEWRVHAPLLALSKADIIRKAVAWGVPYAATISCYDPGHAGRPCGRCEACLIRARGFAEAGVRDDSAGSA
jgi:7-cyano-7-deazaguanine synthase